MEKVDIGIIVVAVGLIIFVSTLLYHVPNCAEVSKTYGVHISTDGMEEVKEILSSEEYGKMTNILAIGNSMYPTICNYSLCRCINTSNYVMGDVIAFIVYNQTADSRMLVSHRIAEETVIENITGVGEVIKAYYTKGDNIIEKDPWIVKEENILCEIQYVPILYKWIWLL